jgi:glucokinase
MSRPIVLGFDLGGTDLKAGVVAPDGVIERFVRQPSRVAESADAPYETIREAARRLLEPGEKIAAIGLGSPGVIDPEDGRLRGGTPHLPHWSERPLAADLRGMFGTPVAVDNDANAAALAEQRVGVARDARVVVMLTLGTGIGCGIVIDGRPLRGAHGGAGELGHVPLGRRGVPCRCGVADCVEPEASGSGLARAARERGLGALDAAGVFARAGAGDPVARELIDGFIDRLAAVVGTVVNVLNPDVVVIGGGVSSAGDALFTPLRASLERYALATHRAGLRLVPPMLGERAGSVGAGLLGWTALASASAG